MTTKKFVARVNGRSETVLVTGSAGRYRVTGAGNDHRLPERVEAQE